MSYTLVNYGTCKILYLPLYHGFLGVNEIITIKFRVERQTSFLLSYLFNVFQIFILEYFPENIQTKYYYGIFSILY